MRKLVLLLLFAITSVCNINAQSNWNFMGTVLVYYGNPNGCKTESAKWAELYSSFDGEKVIYKLIVDGEVHIATKNPKFSQSEYDEYVRRCEDDHFRGPHLKNEECYPFVAGKYRFNPATARK